MGTDSVYMVRATEMKRRFHSLTWSAGVNYSHGKWVVKGNVGKSFRMPIPKELGANGINYHIFRFERGNRQLDPEKSYQLDVSLGWEGKALSLCLEPYLNYFSNYIYLSPTAQYVEGLQLYHYTQARVLRCGLEAQAGYTFNRHWATTLQGEYLWARQRSGEKKGYTLPFSTPWSLDGELKYIFMARGEGYLSLRAHIVGKQDEIVPPEKPTDGYWTLHLTAGKHFSLGHHSLQLTLQANNLLNRRYYDHTSYYRLIDVPEPGFHVSAMARLEF